MRIRDWSSDVCSSDLSIVAGTLRAVGEVRGRAVLGLLLRRWPPTGRRLLSRRRRGLPGRAIHRTCLARSAVRSGATRTETGTTLAGLGRSEEHTSELQSLMRISYAVFCLKKKKA